MIGIEKEEGKNKLEAACKPHRRSNYPILSSPVEICNDRMESDNSSFNDYLLPRKRSHHQRHTRQCLAANADRNHWLWGSRLELKTGYMILTRWLPKLAAFDFLSGICTYADWEKLRVNEDWHLWERLQHARRGIFFSWVFYLVMVH